MLRQHPISIPSQPDPAPAQFPFCSSPSLRTIQFSGTRAVRRGAPSTAERHRAAARSLGGCGRARSVPIAEPSFGAEPQAPAPEEGFAVPAAVFVVVAVEDVRMLAVPFVACPRPVSGVRASVPGVLGCPRPVSGVRCRVRRVSAVRVSVSVRLASASALSAQAGVCGARRCRAAPRFGAGRPWRGRPPCPRAAGLLPESGANGAAEAVLGERRRRPRTWPLSWDALRRRLRPRFDRLPTRTAGWAQRVARRLAEGSRWGSGCARRSPTCWMAAQVVRGRIMGMRPDHDMGWTAAVITLRGRCDGRDPGRSALGGPVGFDSRRTRGPTAAQGCSERDQRRAGSALTCKNCGGRDRV